MCGGVYNGHSYNMLGLTQVECFPNLDSLISAPQTSKPQEHKKTQRTASYFPKTAFPCVYACQQKYHGFCCETYIKLFEWTVS